MSLAMSTALSALTTAQRMAEVASHNIANANTPGYSRQVAVLRPSLPVKTTAGMMGTGVRIDRIMSIRDDFLNSRINGQTTGLGRSEVESQSLSELETVIMPGPDTGISYAVDEFFRSLNELTSNAGSQVSREAVRQSAVTMSDTFKTTTQQLLEIRSNIKDQFQDTVNEANSYFEQIADINSRIMAIAEGSDTANDLVDQRNILIGKLSKIIPVQTTEEGGVTNVLFEGRLVVAGTEHLSLETDASGGTLKLRIGDTADSFITSTGTLGGQSALFNEKIPEYLSYIDEMAKSLIKTVNTIHSTGVGLDNGYTALTSSVELADIDINNRIGDEPLAQQSLAFPAEAGRLYITTTNQETGTMERSYIDYDPDTDSIYDIADKIAALPHMNASVASGYLTITSWPGYQYDFSNKLLPEAGSLGSSQMSVSGAFTGTEDRSFTFYPMNSGTIGETEDLRVAVLDGNGGFLGLLDVGADYTPGAPLEVADGVKVSFDAGTLQRAELNSDKGPFSIADGDTLEFSVNGSPLPAITLDAADFQDPAAATPLEMAAAINDADVGVKATVIDDRLQIVPVQGGPDVRITGGGTAGQKLGLPAGTISTDNQSIEVIGDSDTGGLLTALGINSFFEGSGAGDIKVSAHINANLNNIAAAKTSPPGDNNNAVLLANIKQMRVMNNGTQTFGDYHAAVVGKVGIDSAQASRSMETQTKLIEGLDRQRESVSGVSLEEEMAKLMQTQQAYQAAIKLIQSIDEMLNGLTQL